MKLPASAQACQGLKNFREDQTAPFEQARLGDHLGADFSKGIDFQEFWKLEVFVSNEGSATGDSEFS